MSAFSQDWREEHNWVHPPISALDQVALKIRESPCRATVVAPYWPQKSWSRELLELSSNMDVVPSAVAVTDQAFLKKWSVRGPGDWPLALFHIPAGR